MKNWIYALGFSLGACFANAVLAASAGAIEAVQLPAWLDRGGLTVPVSPGIALQAGDTLRTGTGARLLLKLEEGSLVKLGENAKFVIERAQPKAGVFDAALSVVTGAFRFTTQALAKTTKRDVKIRVGQNATIGIRGTDLWGRGREDKDIVCLIEGKIEITGNDNKALTLDTPLQLFQSTRSAAPEPLTSLPRAQLEVFAAETEIEFGKGATAKGNRKVIVAGFGTRDEARQAMRALRTNGYPAEIATDNTVMIDKMESELSARQLAAQLKAGSGFKEVRVQ
jgi:hypothetical protein